MKKIKKLQSAGPTTVKPASAAGSAEKLDASATWKSLEQYEGDPSIERFLEREFPAAIPDRLDESSRRTFIKLMGASAAFAGLAGCRWPKEEILPFADRPEGRIPGVPVPYATAFEHAGHAQGLLVTSYDGRPVKLDGNPDHPVNAGRIDALSQATVLNLYDPDRSRAPARYAENEKGLADSDWETFEAWARATFGSLAGANSGRLAILTEARDSIGFDAARQMFEQRFPRAKWFEYEPISDDNVREGASIVFGQPMRTQIDLTRADVIVSLDADFLHDHPAAMRHARQFAQRRRVDSSHIDHMSRMHVIEAGLSVTGAMADEHYSASSAAISSIAGQLAVAILGPLSDVPRGLAAALARTQGRLTVDYVDKIADELKAHRGHGVIVAGRHMPPAVHALVHLMNQKLGNVGASAPIGYTPDRSPGRPTHVESIEALTSAMNSGAVDTLVILGGNPAFDAPADVAFAKALENVENTVHLAEYRNETSQKASWHLPRAHFLESWGDARSYDGTVSIVQPLIQPLFGGRTPTELLLLLTSDEAAKAYDFTRNALSGVVAGDAAWRRALRKGIVAGSAPATVYPQPDMQRATRLMADWLPPAIPTDTSLELRFAADPKIYDGRYANNGWLQELPEPMTKLAWDNAVLVSKPTADALGLRSHRMADVTVGESTMRLPVFVMPGYARSTATLWVGQGRTSAGRIGDGVGFDTYALRTTNAMDLATGVTLAPTREKYDLATTQDHYSIDPLGQRETERRLPELVREASVDYFKEHPDFVDHVVHELPSYDLWEPWEFSTGYQWGMSIDLNTCIGCSSCVIACQSENNIPIVGKQEVLVGREMHWLRVDRYYRGDPVDPQVAFQPLTCHHCENAPCEQVCPVAATLHNEEGLNQMVYNRCIGTRYCSNNCPFKVRRFNFWNNHDDGRNLPWPLDSGRPLDIERTELEGMVFNPNVTVRARGVMEKCTYCVQRIEIARSAAKLESREIRDGEVTPACAQACPTQAIVFGDLRDKNSRVRAAQDDVRSYSLLAEIKVRPRTRYQARIRNPVDGGGDHHGGGHGGHGGSHDEEHA